MTFSVSTCANHTDTVFVELTKGQMFSIATGPKQVYAIRLERVTPEAGVMAGDRLRFSYMLDPCLENISKGMPVTGGSWLEMEGESSREQ